MEVYKSLLSQVINLDVKDFPEVALKIFNLQAKNNPVYSTFIKHLGIDPAQISSVDQIPFLPIELFKSKRIVTGNWKEQITFTSSGTGAHGASKHYVRDLEFYLSNSQQIFEQFYGPLSNYHLLALLPGYLERSGSSLIVMMDHFIKQTGSPLSGFYLDDHNKLSHTLQTATEDKSRKTILWGVSFALLNFLEQFATKYPELLIIETGGMKGRRQELIRSELHDILCRSFQVGEVHSEYGMAELTSQAYSLAQGQFQTPPWMRVKIRKIDDPISSAQPGTVGGIDVIDLSNLHSCAFISTQDLGSVSGQTFEVLGRIDHSELRGCNLLVW